MTGERFQAQQLTRDIPSAVWWLTGLFFLLVAFNATTLPAFQPNEPYNVDLVHATRSGSYPRYDQRQVSERVTRLFGVTKFRQDNQHLVRESAPARHDRPPFNQVAPDEPSSLGNHVAQHPPLYYGALALGSAAMRHLPFDQEVALLRILGAVMLLPLPLLAFLTARRLRAPVVIAVAAAAATFVSPEFVMTSAIVNNDTLLRLLFSVITLLIVYAWTGDVSLRTGVLIGVTAGLAMLTKGFGLALLPWIALAYFLAVRRGANRREATRSGVVALGLGTAIGGWWWIYNVLAYGTVQPRIVTHPRAGGSFEPQLLDWARSFVTVVLRLLFGWPYSPRLVVAVMFVGAGVLVLLALPGLRGWGRTLADLAMLLVPIAVMVAMMMYASIPSYYRTSLIGAAEGRYLVTAIGALAVLAAAGGAFLLGRRQRWLPLVALGTCLVFQVAQFWRLLDRQYGRTGAPITDQLDALWAWYPFSPVVLVGLTAGALIVAAFTARSMAPSRFPLAETASRGAPLRVALPVTGALLLIGLLLMTRRVVTGGGVTGVGYLPILAGLAILFGAVVIDTQASIRRRPDAPK